jgi:hypothetical protein
MKEAVVFSDPRYLGFQIQPEFKLEIFTSIDWNKRFAKDE